VPPPLPPDPTAPPVPLAAPLPLPQPPAQIDSSMTAPDAVSRQARIVAVYDKSIAVPSHPNAMAPRPGRSARRGPHLAILFAVRIKLDLASLLFAVIAASCDSSKDPAPAHCQGACQIAGDGALVLSWECYCQVADCSERLANTDGLGCGTRTDYPGCGLVTLTNQTPGGPWIRVFDSSSGALVGVQSGSDTSDYRCPANTSLSSFTRRAGQFPAASCAPVACAPGVCSVCSGDGGAD
jgi:hypothetical protein